MPLPADGSKVKLGKGSLLLDQLTTAGVSQGFDFAGNCSAISLSADQTTAELYSSTQQSAPLIARAVTQISYTLTATMNEYNFAMLKKFLLAEENTKAQSAASKQAFFNQVRLGAYYQIGDRQVTNVAVSVGSVVMTAGTDYLLYDEFGLIKILAGGAIMANDNVVVDYDAPALSISQLRIAKIASPIVHVLYLADDANQDGDAAKDRLEIWRANIAPEGELALISDEYGSYQLSAAVLSDAENHPNDPFGTLDRIAA